MNTCVPLPVGCLLFDRRAGGSAERGEKHAAGPLDRDETRPIRCASCQYAVTSRRFEAAPGGSHAHHGVNPAGFEFDFLCYEQAPGCRRSGAPTLEHSWFAGHHWQLALCRSCGEHLGWFFEGSSAFFGLIAARLVLDG